MTSIVVNAFFQLSLNSDSLFSGGQRELFASVDVTQRCINFRGDIFLVVKRKTAYNAIRLSIR